MNFSKRLLPIALALAPIAAAQKIDCPPINQDLVKVPELIAKDGKLRATIVLEADEVNIPTRTPTSPPTPSSTTECYPQFVRILRGVDAVPPYPSVPANGFPLPMPGPTLRARVGDLVQITFLNQIDPGDFPYSVDRGETVAGGGCDETSVYPKNVGDKYPNCFHGSSTANIHFHGSHTNPNSTGDNVFVEVRPSLRVNDQPIVTQESVRAPFDEFFRRCEQELLPTEPLKIWPAVWEDLPKAWQEKQKELIDIYDKNPRVAKKLWPVNKAQLAKGNWPQYNIGAFPYCFRLPEYKESTWPPAPPAEHTAVHAAGAGTAEKDVVHEPQRPLLMGQAPGLHWYHAHKHGSTAINVANGMTGAFVIEGKYDDELDAYYGKGWTRRQPVIVINQLGVSPNLERRGPGRLDKGPDFSVNGRLRPVIQMRPGEVQLWRIVNTSGRSGVYFTAPPAASPPRFSWKQIAQDGVQFADVNYQNNLNAPFLLASGNRADILVKAPTATGGLIPLQVQNVVDPDDLATQPQLTLLNVNVSGEPVNMDFIPKAPSFPPFLADIKDEEVTGTKKLVFSSTSPPTGQHFIDGKQFSGEVGQVVLLNRVEEWKVMNATYAAPISHPFHIHINPFQVVEVFNPNEKITDPRTGLPVPKYVFDKAALKVYGQCYLDPFGNPDDWKPCGPPQPTPENAVWWDVFPIPSGVEAKDAKGNSIVDPKTKQPIGIPGYFKMRSRFVDYPGFYVLHCHILAHEDRGMMTIVEVAPLQSPYSHH